MPKQIQFSLKSALGVFSFIAISLGAYKAAGEWSCAILLTAELLMVWYGLVITLAARADRSGWWSGFTSATIGYFLLFTSNFAGWLSLNEVNIHQIASQRLGDLMTSLESNEFDKSSEATSNKSEITPQSYTPPGQAPTDTPNLRAMYREKVFDGSVGVLFGILGGCIGVHCRRERVSSTSQEPIPPRSNPCD